MKKYYFNTIIKDWHTWGKVFMSKEAFEPLIRKIFSDHGLDDAPIENCKPGTNGVFKVGNYLIKIFVPLASGYDASQDYTTEVFGLNYSASLGIPVPAIVAKGEIEDRYNFKYLILDYIKGTSLGDLKDRLSKEEKEIIGAKLKKIVLKWGKNLEAFNDIDPLKRTQKSLKWQGAPLKIKETQNKLIHDLDEKVFVHGDLTADNILVDKDLNITIIDFADSLLAPSAYELMPIIGDAFSFDLDFLRGFYGHLDKDKIVEDFIKGTLIHEYGFMTLNHLFGPVGDISQLKKNILDQWR